MSCSNNNWHSNWIFSISSSGSDRLIFLESTRKPRYSHFWLGIITDFFQLIRNPRCSNNQIVEFMSTMRSVRDWFNNRRSSKNINMLIPRRRSIPIIGFNSFVNIWGPDDRQHCHIYYEGLCNKIGHSIRRKMIFPIMGIFGTFRGTFKGDIKLLHTSENETVAICPGASWIWLDHNCSPMVLHTKLMQTKFCDKIYHILQVIRKMSVPDIKKLCLLVSFFSGNITKVIQKYAKTDN